MEGMFAKVPIQRKLFVPKSAVQSEVVEEKKTKDASPENSKITPVGIFALAMKKLNLSDKNCSIFSNPFGV